MSEVMSEFQEKIRTLSRLFRSRLNVAYIISPVWKEAITKGLRRWENNSSQIACLYDGFLRMANVDVFVTTSDGIHPISKPIFDTIDKYDLYFFSHVTCIQMNEDLVTLLINKKKRFGAYFDGSYYNFRDTWLTNLLSGYVYPYFDFIATAHQDDARFYNRAFRDSGNERGLAFPVGRGTEDFGELSEVNPYSAAHGENYDPDRKRIIYAGTLNPDKVHYVQKMMEVFPDANFYLVIANLENRETRGYSRVEVVKLFPMDRTFFISDWLVGGIGTAGKDFVGPCPYGSFRNYLTWADMAFVYPWPKSYIDGLIATAVNSKLYTYWEAGCPALVPNDNVGVHEVVYPLGTTCDWNDPDDIRDKGNLLMNSLTRGNDHIRNIAVERYSWERIAEQILVTMV